MKDIAFNMTIELDFMTIMSIIVGGETHTQKNIHITVYTY